MKTIRILEADANRRGDLFGRLMADLFVALGYEQPRLNIHKSGREIDLDANHRLEPRRAIAECKATEDKSGGADLNKFVGALDVEHVENIQVTGYFISLSGFKETALEQEKQRKTKIVTLTGEQVVHELIKGRIIIPSNHATELAGRICRGEQHLMLDGTPELVAHDRGWIWIIYYSDGKVRTKFVLVHADGTPLALPLAQQIVASDKAIGGSLHKLICLNPPPQSSITTPELEEQALKAYGRYITEECGAIQLDGLPADGDVGSRRLKLEDLFVPLHLDIPLKEKKRHPLGEALMDSARLAILAAPGGGKSTLIKRLAVAYADPQRRALIQDHLPEKDWLPLFFRCRDLRGLARASFAELLDTLANREPVRQYAEVFRALADRALVEGRVLLLVDGLDEISDAGDRAAFVCTMRTALQAYPGTSFIVTSREAGFRHVAAHLGPVCTKATLSPFDAEDIRRLSVAWHTEVVGDTEKVRNDAEQLAFTISGNDRIQRLAVNPLLLTTLLLVKRWVGSLPTRRAVLYGKAVEVLLMTWNTEGHEPIPEEEALPQLCYVASAMMIEEVERISRPRLATLIQEARDSLPTELGYVKESVEGFIHRVEDRSSLLMMTGQDVENGRLVEFFEFRHLTFQEFLTARAMVEGWHPGRSEADTLVSVLEPYFDKEKWGEVIPLSASLGGKATEALIVRLTDNDELSRGNLKGHFSAPVAFVALGHCLADEAAARPETIRSALRVLVKEGLGDSGDSFGPMLARGRYGDELRDEAERLFLATEDFRLTAFSLKKVVWWQATDGDERKNGSVLAAQFSDMMRDADCLTRCKGALACAELFSRRQVGMSEAINVAAGACLPLLFAEDCRENYCAGWLLYYLGKTKLWTPPAEPDVLGRIFNLWQNSNSEPVRRAFASLLAMQKLESRESRGHFSTVNPLDVSTIFKNFSNMSLPGKVSALVAGWYTHILSDQEIVDYGKQILHESQSLDGVTAMREIMIHLGEYSAPDHMNPS